VPSIRAGELEQLVTPSFIRHLAMPRSVICTHQNVSSIDHLPRTSNGNFTDKLRMIIEPN
jgi:hypothetical protein